MKIEIVFPVASEAITATGEGENDGNMSVVPGVSGENKDQYAMYTPFCCSNAPFSSA